MKEKLKNFVSQLSDDEVYEQLENIFEWAKTYKDMLEEEKKKRNSSAIQTRITNYYDIEDSSDEFEIEEDVDSSETIDFNLAQMIHQKISLLSVEETEKCLEKLKNISTQNLTNEEKSRLLYEIEECEMHLYEFTGGSESLMCRLCGNILEENAKFCGVCGAAILL